MTHPSLLNADRLPFVMKASKLDGRVPPLEALTDAGQQGSPVPVTRSVVGKHRRQGFTDLDRSRSPVPRTSRLVGLLLATALVWFAVSPASAAARKPGCQAGKVAVASGCVSRREAANHIVAITRATMRALRIKAAIVRVDTGSRALLSRAFGSSMAGVPARRDMRFRIGSMAIPYLITLLLQLQDQGRLSLDDKLSRFLPAMPNADRVTLRMLADNTSGYPDWIQGNDAFTALFDANVFRQWTPAELLAQAFARPPVCEPGACFSYAHTNYAVLSKVIAHVTGRSVASLMRRRIFKPLGLRQTDISTEPAMHGPVLHAYTAQRGPYEDSTYWSPSWTLGAGSVMSSTIGDVARTARAIGTGALISTRASRERFAPTTVGMGTFTKHFYFALGILVVNGWYLQNPLLNGYTGAMAYLPGRDISVAIVATHRLGASDELSYAPLLFAKLTAYLSPRHTVVVPGSAPS